MSSELPRWFRPAIAFAVFWHVFSVLAHGWLPALEEKHGRDFASFYYATEVAFDGGDPYKPAALAGAARADATRNAVHPFFYPPPAIGVFSWTRGLSLIEAYRVWFWLDELAALVAVGLLGWGWRRLDASWPVVIAVAFALLSAVPDNHLMGQANFLALALAFGGLLAERQRPALGGALVGAAAMVKMSPGLFVVGWLAQRKYPAAIAAVVTAAVLSLLSLFWVGADVQVEFYQRVLPGFSSGAYNGLKVPIKIFGNHSMPSLIATLLPNSRPIGLSSAARAVSIVADLALVGAALWAMRRPAADHLAEMARYAAIAVMMLLVPVFTYEHHVIWALPAVAVSAVALRQGRLDARFAFPLGFAFAAWAFDLSEAKAVASRIATHSFLLGGVIAELKFLALCTFLIATVWVARSPARES